MKRLKILLPVMLYLAFKTVQAAETVWHDRDGRPIPDDDTHKSRNGFAVGLLVTPDPDWEAKWNPPAETIPTFRSARTVRRGGALTILIFLVNPKTNHRNLANVRCDLQVARPDGSLSVNAKDVVCLKGELRGSPMAVRLATPVLKFKGEANDPLGEWHIVVVVRDVLRATELQLESSFVLNR